MKEGYHLAYQRDGIIRNQAQNPNKEMEQAWSSETHSMEYLNDLLAASLDLSHLSRAAIFAIPPFFLLSPRYVIIKHTCVSRFLQTRSLGRLTSTPVTTI